MSAGNLSTDIQKFLESGLSTLYKENVDPKNIEIEVRFGYFTEYNNKKRFESGISRRHYIQLKTYFLSRCQKPPIYVHSIDRTYNQYENFVTERFTTLLEKGIPVKKYRTLKQPLRPLDLPDYLMRIGIAKEINDETPEPTTQVLWMREKKRYSFEMGPVRFDFTEITTPDRETKEREHRKYKTVYEIEIELLDKKALPVLIASAFVVYKELLGSLGSLQIKIDNMKLAISQPEKLKLISHINAWTGSQYKNSHKIDHTILTNARTIKARDLTSGSLVPDTPNNNSVYYTMTIKADGVLKMLVVDETGLYLVGPPDNFIKIQNYVPQLKEFMGSVFVGELVENKVAPGNTGIYLFFDVVAKQGSSDIQGLVFEQRINFINKFFSVISSVWKDDKLKFQMKEFIVIDTVSRFFEQARKFYEAKYPFATDGLILTPYNYPYHTTLTLSNVFQRRLYKDPDILKVKSTEFLTVDFEIRHEQEGLFLYSSGKDESVRFVGSKEYSFDALTQLKISNEMKSSPSGMIFEFRWDGSHLIPTRSREDKDKANSVNIAQDVWADMHAPIEQKTITGEQFGLSFRYHNRVKTELHQIANSKYPFRGTSPQKYLLSIGAGKGGDVWKWKTIGITHVVCVEPNEKNREELQRRL